MAGLNRIGIGLMACALCAAGEPGEMRELLEAQPSKSLSPPDVIRLQLSALANNGQLGSDRGIEVTWRFASPANKALTGPLARFRRMVKGGYFAMLNHRRSTLGELDLTAVEAKQVVILEDAQGGVHVYVWVLGLQEEGPFRGCWMTDAVVELAPSPTEPESAPKPGTVI